MNRRAQRRRSQQRPSSRSTAATLSEPRPTPAPAAEQRSAEPRASEAPGPRGPLAWWQRLDPGWRLALGVVIAQRIVLGVVGVASLYAAGVIVSGGSWAELVIQGGEPWSALLSTWQRWDALWYQHIVQAGYRAGDGSTAFYPLYPLLVKLVSVPLLGHTVWAALLVSTAAAVVALGLLHALVHFEHGGGVAPDDRNRVGRGAGNNTTLARGRRAAAPVQDPRTGSLTERIARGAVLGVALFPTGFFLLAPYPEGLFLALGVGAFLCARQGRWWLAGACGFGVALTRTQGVLLALPLIYEYVHQRGSAGWVLGAGGRAPDLRAVMPLAPLLGFAVVTVYWRAALGEGGGIIGIQSLWGYQLVPPWEALAASWRYFAIGSGATTAHSLPIVEALNFACLLGFSALAVAMIRFLPLSYALYVWPSLGLLFFREMSFSPLMSVSRFVVVLFPVYIVLARLLVPRPVAAVGALVAGALLQIALYWFWVQWGFVA